MKALSFDAYTLKWIAVIGMIANHVAIGLAPVLPLWVVVFIYGWGGLTYVIMAFFVVEGYKHTSNLKKYIGRLLIFGVIAQAFHPTVLGATNTAGGPIFLNIMFTIALSLVVLYLYDTVKIRPLFWLLLVVACVVSMFMDIMIMGVLVPLLYYIIKNEKRRRTVPGVVSGIFFGLSGVMASMVPIIYLTTGQFAEEVHYLADSMGLHIYMMAAMPTFAIGSFLGAYLIRNYNGERGKRSKWLFYVAYPVHLAIIAAIMVVAGVSAFNLFGFFVL